MYKFNCLILTWLLELMLVTMKFKIVRQLSTLVWRVRTAVLSSSGQFSQYIARSMAPDVFMAHYAYIIVTRHTTYLPWNGCRDTSGVLGRKKLLTQPAAKFLNHAMVMCVRQHRSLPSFSSPVLSSYGCRPTSSCFDIGAIRATEQGASSILPTGLQN